MPDQRTHTDVVMTALAALNPFRSQGPSDPLGEAPYCVVYPGVGNTSGPQSAPWADLAPEVQVTAVGVQSDQAEVWADKVFAALVGVVVSPPAGRAWQRPAAPIGHVLTRPVQRDDDVGVGAPMFYVAAIYDLPSTPA